MLVREFNSFARAYEGRNATLCDDCIRELTPASQNMLAHYQMVVVGSRMGVECDGCRSVPHEKTTRIGFSPVPYN